MTPFLNYGKLPLGNAFLTEEQLEDAEKFDLELGFCRSCTLVQQMKPAPMESLSRVYRNYAYVPVGDTLTRHLSAFGHTIVTDFNLSSHSFVVDIGSNDGALLSNIKNYCRVLGVEPAKRISQIARSRGVETITDFFTVALAQKIVEEYGKADVVMATQTMQHIPSLEEFLNGLDILLKPEGIFVEEGRYLADMFRKLSFDSVYHEMLYFFSLGSLVNLFERFDMEVFGANLTDVYGGSLRVYVKKRATKRVTVHESVRRILAMEEQLGFHRSETYLAFAEKVLGSRKKLVNLFKDLKTQGALIAAYGAPSTGNTLLNFCGINRDYIEYIVDDSPLKQGLFAPGSNIPIVSANMLQERRPDYLLILAWRLKDEIMPKLKVLRDRGMKLIVPLPDLEVI